MQEQLITFETAKLAKEKGFDSKYTEDYDTLGIVQQRSMLETYNLERISAPTQSLLQKWLREEHDTHIQLRKENYFYVSRHEYFHYDISKGEDGDITGQQDLCYSIMDECSQDIPGNHLNVEKYKDEIFKRKFAFSTYEEALEEGLQEALKLID